MKKKIVYMIMALLVLSVQAMRGQSFDALWKQDAAAENKDLPQTRQEVLRQIAIKAEKEKAYGHLLKAELMQARVQASVSPDSLQPAVERLKERAEAMKDVPLQAVYYAALSIIYQNNSSYFEDWQQQCDTYKQKAMAHPAELAAVKVDSYEPFVVKGKDSQYYGNDLLSLIGTETKQYRAMLDYYLTTSNRRAQLFCADKLLEEEEPSDWVKLSEATYLTRIDSLIERYADLVECGELALTRFEYMNEHTDATAEQKVNYIDEALSRWGAWKRTNWLRNYRQDLTAVQFNASLAHRVWIPDSPQRISLYDLRGIHQLSIHIYKVKADGDTELNPEIKEDYKKLKPLLTAMPERTITRNYTGKKDYELFNDSLMLDGLPVGVYMMEVESQPHALVSRTLFSISNVRVLAQMLPERQIRYVVVNATTGKPLPGASLRLSQLSGNRKDNTVTTLTTNSKGEYIYFIQKDIPREIFATTKDDRACPPLNAYGRFSYYEKQGETEQIAVYTDRAIYRPGQTVQVAAICYEVKNGFEHEAKEGKLLKVSLRDANYKTVEEKQLTTDAYGSVSTQFTLPSSALTGRFTVQVGTQSQSFRVEEYKRPTFQVEFPKVEQDYKNGDTLTVKATAHTYAGVPVQGANVKYKVERRMAYWWISYYRYWEGGYYGDGSQNEEIYSGETVTADDGTFEVQMPMVLPKTQYPLFYNFVVVADVTDLAGETHQAQLSLPLGNRKTALTTDLPEQVLAEQAPQLKLHVLNAAGIDVPATISYQIASLPLSSSKGKWQSVQSNTSFALPKLKSGKYQLQAVFEGDTLRREFVVFSLDDKRPVIKTDDWFYVSASQFPNDGKPVTLQVGSSDDVHIVYTLVAGNNIIEQGAVDRQNELVNRKLTYKPEYGNGLTLSFAWVRNGKTYHHETKIQRPLPDKQLKLKWETFRDRLTPGQQEEWTLSIAAPSETEGDKRPAKAQLLATLYDKSLDQIVAHQWSLQPSVWLPTASLRWLYGAWGVGYCADSYHEKTLSAGLLQFNHFDKNCFPVHWLATRNVMRLRGAALQEVRVGTQMAKTIPQKEIYSSAMDESIGAMDVAGNDEALALEGRIAGLNLKEKKTDESSEEVQLPEARQNLQETAFFYPQLLTDSTGRVSLKFTLPESLTTWRFMGIAHTKDMMYGFIDGEAIAQKDVMVQPNVPRFVRMGDQATVSARIFNTSEQTLSGTAGMQLIDPESETVMLDERKAFSCHANNACPVSFPIDGSKLKGHSLLVCKVWVSGETFSDGEQHYLPVLPDCERVTVTVPFTQTQPGTKTIDLAKIIPSSADRSPLTSKLTIEYTNNPAWLMIQALPTIGKPCDKNAVSQAASLYANTLGRYILAQNPNARQVFERWKREDASLSTLHSSLQQNEELKDLLLNETPWVMDADREAEQKQRLADFFDENLMQQRLETAMKQLSKLQNADGSWSWWEGMRGSFFMTVEISEMLVRLNQMAGVQEETKPMLDNAFAFMNHEVEKLVAEMKKQEKKGVKQVFPTFKALQYLYLSTLDGRSQPANVQQAQTYLKNLLKKDISKQTIYEKALSAIILHSPLYIKSLKEYTVYKEEMGRYYDTPRAGYSWRDYRIPTQVAAIEALQRLTPNDTLTIDEMRRWLLQEKHTQAWDTPINSVNAIYAFLNGNKQALSAQPKTVLKIDGKPIETSEATAAIGYVKASMSLPSPDNGQGTGSFTAEKTSTGTSWGAVYAQFMQPAKDISDQKSGISVKREIVKTGDAVHTPLKVGDRIKIRLTIEADRDYDFVQVVDKRAACLEPVQQLSGYRNGAYCSPKDYTTNYYFDILHKGKHVIETEYYVDRQGTYETGTCTVGCAYAPEFRGTAHSVSLTIEQ